MLFYAGNNLPMSVAIKQQLYLCFRFKANHFDTSLISGSGQLFVLEDIPHYASFKHLLPFTLQNNKSKVFCLKWVKIQKKECCFW